MNKLSGKQLGFVVGGGITALLAGGLIASGMKNNAGQTILLASVMSFPAIAGVHLVLDGQATRRINEAEEKLSLEAGKVANAKYEAAESFEKWQTTKLQLAKVETHNSQLSAELAAIQQALEATRQTLQVSETERSNLGAMMTHLQKSLDELQVHSQAEREHIEQLQLEVEAWEAQFHDRVEVESQRRFKQAQKQEIQRIFDEQYQITAEAMELFRRLQQWGEKVASGHESKRQIITSLAGSYNQNLDEINQAIDRERQQYIQQIELLHEKVARLQAALNGDLLEPELVDARYNPDLDLGNALCREIFYQFKIPLRFYHAYTTEDGVFHAGFMLSKGEDRRALASKLSESSSSLADALRLHKIEAIAPADVLEGIEIRARRSRPQPVSDDAIYRLIEPSKNCCQILRDAMNHRKGGKPTLRIMSATGGGKGIVAKAFIADWVKSMNGELWLSDPMDGSSEDYWEIPKAAKSAREGSKLLGEFSSEFYARKNKSSEHKGVLVLGVFDEFDKQHPDDDKEKVQEIWTAIRHHDMRLVLMGQSSEVGVNGWTWDAMKNCALLFVGNAITTAIKQAKNIGLSGASKGQIERNYDTIKLYLEDKNKGLASDVMYRVALLIVDDTFKFLELPPAYKGTIESGTATIVSSPWESFVSTNSTASLSSENTLENALKARICPGCKGKLRKSGQWLRCENPNHAKDMGIKNFRIVN